MDMTKRAVREALGFTMDRQLAGFFGVGKAAVSNWAEDEPLPEVRQWQAKALRPDVFGPAPKKRKRAA
ncbi:transcriptional regulator with XRE-family HTH domain [Xanthomonas arboricola]|uniref:helix-turn-helix domain-containing protein n=1 Tax=Xanthomonas cannabis TaxID=1885674 RepID=UPI0016197C7F|nr:helix-turn-helix domain-containing protein [Xanthomonas cannabis]MBB3802020.1 transcriptional regulator with XRE-family HTH domain [Xanthomonas cannabis]